MQVSSLSDYQKDPYQAIIGFLISILLTKIVTFDLKMVETPNLHKKLINIMMLTNKPSNKYKANFYSFNYSTYCIYNN